MSVLAGEDSLDPFSISDDVDWLSAPKTSIKGITIGFCPDLGGFPVEPEILAAIEATVSSLRREGANIVPLKLKLPRPHQEYTEAWCRIITANSVATFADMKTRGIDLEMDHAGDFPNIFFEYLYAVRNMSLLDQQADQNARSEIWDLIEQAFTKVDIIASATVGCLPVENRNDGLTAGPTNLEGQTVNPLIGWCPTYFTNFTGHPAASLPAGLVRGLPVGLQLIGRRRNDATVLSTCASVERVKPWKDIYRLCATRGGISADTATRSTPNKEATS
jgi:amidase/aspartyl-tRNA(Asn)/glutamyl-tRNA(Gln) amidotransferase subunit A